MAADAVISFTGFVVNLRGDSSRLDLEVMGIGLLSKWVLEGEIGMVGETLVVYKKVGKNS